MLPALALLLLAASPPSPRVVTGADGWVFAPKLESLSGLGAWSREAGRSTPLLRSAVFSEELLPLLQVDLTDAAALARAGVDAAGPFTASLLPAGRVACFTVKDVNLFRGHADGALRREGPAWTGTVPGVTAAAALRGTEPALGYVLSNRQACVVSAPRRGGAWLLRTASKLLGSPPAPAGWKEGRGLPGEFFLGGEGLLAGVRASATGLVAEGRASALPGGLPGALGPGPTPYGAVSRTGPGLLRARLDPARLAGLARGLAGQLARTCRECDTRAAERAADVLGSLLTGHVVLHVEGFRLRPPPRTREARYFALRHGWATEVKDPPGAARALEALAAARGFRKAGGGVVLATPDGEVQVGLSGSHLYVANDAVARQALLAALKGAAPGRLAHGLEAELEPSPLGKALSGVSLLDAVANAEAAGLFAVALELGPLLRASGNVTWSADAAGTAQRFRLEWPLAPR
jgi:hypothetical protein